MANALKGLTLLLEKLAPVPSAARSRMEEAESMSARLALSADLRASYESCKKGRRRMILFLCRLSPTGARKIKKYRAKAVDEEL